MTHPSRLVAILFYALCWTYPICRMSGACDTWIELWVMLGMMVPMAFLILAIVLGADSRREQLYIQQAHDQFLF